MDANGESVRCIDCSNYQLGGMCRISKCSKISTRLRKCAVHEPRNKRTFVTEESTLSLRFYKSNADGEE